MNGPSESDRVVERLLRQSASSEDENAEPGPGCLDAENMAAWMDGGLSGPSLQRAESHVAACGRCQTVLATLARIQVPSPASGPEPETAARRWHLWLVPLIGAAAALVLWVAVPRESPARPPVDSVAVRGETPPPARELFRDELRLESAREASPPAPPLPAGKVGAPADSQVAENPSRARQERQDASPQLSRPDSAAAGAAADAAVSAPAPPAAAVGQPPPTSPPIAAARLEQVDRVARAQESPAVPGTVPIITSPVPAVRWRLLGSTVERTADGGVVWEQVYRQPGVVLTVGTAPSANVCWIVGRGGAIIRTTDGRTFSRVPFPNTLHLASVTATDASTASVTTVSGLTFETADGGQTWRQQP